MRLQVARRRELRERGVSSAVVRGMNLATKEDLAKAEEAETLRFYLIVLRNTLTAD